MLLALGIIAIEVLWISQQFDALTLTLRGKVTGWRSLFARLGDVAKLCVAIAFTTGLLLHTHFADQWRSLQQHITGRRFLLMLPLQLACYALLMLLTVKIFADPKAAASVPAVYFGLWLVACLFTFITWLYLFTTTSWLRQFARQEKVALLVGTAVGTLVWALALYTRELWGPMSELTFYLASLLLYVIAPETLVVNVEEKILGISDFAVNIAPACSGYEGVGLVTAFTAIYLWLHRHQLRFPRVLLLFPIAALAIWLLNVVRICVLILIGHYWSPEIAVGGFHSQAGWLTFILTSLAILWLAGDSAFFSRTGKSHAAAHIDKEQSIDSHSAAITGSSSEAPPQPTTSSDQAVAMILPLVILLASSLLTASFSGNFDWLYPIRVVAVGATIIYVWPQLRLLPYRMRPIAPIAGLATAVIWIMLLGDDQDYNRAFSDTLSAAPHWLASVWLLLRLIGTAITVPIAEELAFRGYVLCKLSHVEPTTRGRIPFVVVAVVVSSLAFGALHGAWIAGTVAGLIYALVRLRSDNITDAIVAHGVTNALLFAYAGFTGAWHLL